MNNSVTVVGLQWGDEGKGKLVDILANSAQLVVRYQGGNNAGHTLVTGSSVVKVSMLPSGVLQPEATVAIAAGVVVNADVLEVEVRSVEAQGYSLKGRLVVDENAHLVLPSHVVRDKQQEEVRGTAKIGTTGRGIGPAHEDRARRCGVAIGELRNLPLVLERVLSQQAPYGEKEELYSYLHRAAEFLLPRVGDVSSLIRQAISKNQKVIFEGAQAVMLDVLFGTAPYVTASHTLPGAVGVGCGVNPHFAGKIIGVAKAYCTRVGEGPFPSELLDERGELLRTRGKEFGTVTGRPRRCGALDIPALRRAVLLGGCEELALMKLDVLSGLSEIPLCTRYKGIAEGADDRGFPYCGARLSEASAEFIFLPGWAQDLSLCRSYEELPSAAQEYIRFIEKEVGTSIRYISVGPERTQFIECKND